MASCLAAAASAALAHEDDAAVHCDSCAEWNQPQQPFNLYGNTWYVGTGGLSAVLITSGQGHILLDGALPQSAPLIARNIESLGFRLKDVKLIVNSHAHYDHAGGIAALRRMTGAAVAASASGARVLEAGTLGTDDPQYDAKKPVHVEQTPSVRVVKDGEVLRVGELALSAHLTPGHTPGSTTWSWTSCEDGRCLNVVYADSLNPVSLDGYYFSGQTGAGSADDISASFKASIAKVAALPCDIIISVHPDSSGLFEKLAGRKAGANPFIDPASCRNYAAKADRALTARLAREAQEKAGKPGG